MRLDGRSRLRPGLPHGGRADPARRRLRDAGGAPGGRSAPTLLLRALDERPPFAEQPEDGVTYAEKITAADRTLDPRAPAEVNARIVRALHPHIGARLALDDGTFLGVHRAAWARTARSSCSRSSRRAGGRWPTRTTCAAARRAEARRGRRSTSRAMPPPARGVHERGPAPAPSSITRASAQRALEIAPLAGRDDRVGGRVARQHRRADRRGVVGGGGVAQIAEGGQGLHAHPVGLGRAVQARQVDRPGGATTQASGRRTASMSGQLAARRLAIGADRQAREAPRAAS